MSDFVEDYSLETTFSTQWHLRRDSCTASYLEELASMETNLDTKLTQLTMAVKRTGKILDAGKRESIKRHLETLQTIIKEANQCKGTVEAQNINDKEDISKIDKGTLKSKPN